MLLFRELRSPTDQLGRVAEAMGQDLLLLLLQFQQRLPSGREHGHMEVISSAVGWTQFGWMTANEPSREEEAVNHGDVQILHTTPQMTRFRGAIVCSKWLQQRIDDHNIQSDYKCTIGPQVPKREFSYWLCMRGDVHDYTTDTNDIMTTKTDFHTEHINMNTWVRSIVLLESAYRHTSHFTVWLKSELCPSFHSHPHALMMCAVLPRHWSLHSLHHLPLAPPVAFLPLPWGS